MFWGSSVGCCPVPWLPLVYLPLQHASNISRTSSDPNLPISSLGCPQTPGQVEDFRNLDSPMGRETAQGSDLPQDSSYSPAQNSLAWAQAVTNGLSLLPGWWSVRSRPVPRLWGRGTWAACPRPPSPLRYLFQGKPTL